MNSLGVFIHFIVTKVLETAAPHGVPEEIRVWRDKSGAHHATVFDYLIVMASCNGEHPYQHFCLRAVIPWKKIDKVLSASL